MSFVVQVVLNFCLLTLLCVTYPVVFLRDVVRHGPTVRAGLSFGVMHLLLLPLLSCALTGTLVIDQEFRATTLLPDLDWSLDAHAVTVMLLPMVTMLFAFPFLPRPEPSTSARPIATSWWVAGYVAIAIFSFFLSGLGSADAHWYRTREAFSRDNGLAAVLLLFVQSGVQLLAVASLFSDVQEKRTSYRTMAILMTIIAVVDLYTTGNRIWVLFMIACVAVTLLRRRLFGVIGLLSLLLIPFGYLMAIFRWIRAYMHASPDRSLAGIFDALLKAYGFAQDRVNAEGFGVNGFVNGVSEAVDVAVYHAAVIAYSGSRPLIWGATFLKVLVFWIPRSIWPGKPDGVSVVAAQVFAPSVDDLSLITTIFGEFYMNFGTIFIVITPLAVVLLTKFAALLAKRIPFANFLMFVFGVAIVRFPISDFLLILFVAVLIYVAGAQAVRLFNSGSRPPSRARAETLGV